MNRRRWAILSAEAAVLGLVILVVYLTLLRPDGDSPLFDVDVPGDGQRTAQGPSRGERDRAPDGRDARAGARAERGEPSGPEIEKSGELTSGRGVGPRRGVGPAVGAPGVPLPGAEDSPTADQYLDTLARLNANVNAAYD